jgi:uncharacterized membrane protein YbhN (UPF0104 family)
MNERPRTLAFYRHQQARQLLRLLVVAAVVALIIVTVPGLGSLRARLTHTNAGWVIAAAALEVASVGSFVVAFQRAFAPRLSWRDSAALGTTAQGINALVPAGGTGGLAAAAVLLARAGIPRSSAISRMLALFVLTAVVTNVAMVIVGGIGVGTGLLPGHAGWSTSYLLAGLAVLVVLVAAWLVRRPSRPASPPATRWQAFKQEAARDVRDGFRCTGQLLAQRDPLLILGCAGFVLFDLAALAAAFRAVGSVGLPLGTMMLAYTLGQVGSIISLPGTTEGGLLGVFVLYGAPVGVTASAILVYRAAETLVPLVLGIVGVGGLRRLAPELTPDDGVLPLEAQ